VREKKKMGGIRGLEMKEGSDLFNGALIPTPLAWRDFLPLFKQREIRSVSS